MADPLWMKLMAGWRGPPAERSASSWYQRARLLLVRSGTPEAPPIAPRAARPGSALPPGRLRLAAPPPRPAGRRGRPRRDRPRSLGKRGAAAGAPVGQRLGAARVV